MSAPGRIALVTGASRGIGRAAAVALAAAGHHVILVARTVGGLEETDDLVRAAGGSATLVPLDLKDFAALDRLGASLFERWGRLDAWFANAGVLGALSPLAHLDPKLLDELVAVNITANARLIRSLDPLLRASEAGRGHASGAVREFEDSPADPPTQPARRVRYRLAGERQDGSVGMHTHGAQVECHAEPISAAGGDTRGAEPWDVCSS